MYWCSFYAPCLGVFLPVFVEGDLPPVLAEGDGIPSDTSPWWRFRQLERLARADSSGEVIDLVHVAWRALQDEWLATAYDLAIQAFRVMEVASRGCPAQGRA